MELKAASVSQDYAFAEQYNGNSDQPKDLMIVHQDFKLHDLENFEANRRRMIGTMTTIDIPSFFSYVKRREEEVTSPESRTFIDASKADTQLVARTVLNFGSTYEPGHCDDVAVLNMQHDPLFQEFLSTFEGETFGAVKFADAFEDLIGVLKMNGHVDGERVTIASAISVIRNAKVDAAQNTTVRATQFASEVSDMERVEISSNGGQLPTYFSVITPLYLGLPEQEIFFKVKAETVPAGENKTKLQFSIKPIGLLGAYLKAGKEFLSLISQEFDPETVTIGTYSKK